MNARREDTRNKIQLGGLVIKAGLDEYPTAVILGAMHLAANALKGPKSYEAQERFRAAGDALFLSGKDGGNRN
ncbi:conjugal transfer protein TraD [Aeromonas salmonicida subsp. salmonicida]|uniref:Conjugative protein n=4 Tax=Gammaproteobacteria TaxID=1236 RepID=A5JHK3_9GAMM|nr:MULTISPECIES: conjugal transfer protein TraD [Gammaproteobacteria]EDR6252705.1 conjugal transfer protein TraD [Salmonella enterica]EGD0397197.1 conjugal transfer protein TraD [Salmonella enterica subsp. enterica serovar Agona]MCK9466541.1 conjugal transfer protein TraD [Thiopseudomonas sp.]ABQ41451.1 TraD [Aeromonas bestiarum]AIM49735.1 conjugative protein [Aeromonas salmonicida subsp. salmonicida]